MSALLEFRNVSKIYKRGDEQTTALDDLSLTLQEDQPTIVTVAGESGSGKTTLAMLLLGFIEPTSGEILYKGKRIDKLSGREKITFRREVQAVFQDPFAVFNPFYTVDHLLEVPIRCFKLCKNKRDAKVKIDEALTAVGLQPDEILGRYPHQLSGGQRQRINIARALIIQPKILVADEPVSMVDASLRANILETLRVLQQDYGVSIIYITHDLTTAYHVADSIMVLYRGSVMEAGGVDEVIRQPQHPYTQLLVDSIPWPDLERRWGSTDLVPGETTAASAGCKFSARCPQAMSICATSPSSLYQLQPHQAAACHLFQDKPQLDGEQLSQILPQNVSGSAILPDSV